MRRHPLEETVNPRVLIMLHDSKKPTFGFWTRVIIIAGSLGVGLVAFEIKPFGCGLVGQMFQAPGKCEAAIGALRNNSRAELPPR